MTEVMGVGMTELMGGEVTENMEGEIAKRTTRMLRLWIRSGGVSKEYHSM